MINAKDLAHLSIALAFAIVVMIQGNVIEISFQIMESLLTPDDASYQWIGYHYCSHFSHHLIKEAQIVV